MLGIVVGLFNKAKLESEAEGSGEEGMNTVDESEPLGDGGG